MTPEQEQDQWHSITTVCGRDKLTHQRLAAVCVDRPNSDGSGRFEVLHLAAVHAFHVPASDRAWLDQISRLGKVQVIYNFRYYEPIEFEATVVSPTREPSAVDCQGSDLWISNFGRKRAANTHIRAMKPLSQSALSDATETGIFNLDLTRFEVPAQPACVFCTKPLERTAISREHLVPQWVRSLTADEVGEHIHGVVVDVHAGCNSMHASDEEKVRPITTLLLAGKEPSRCDFATVEYWMSKRMCMLDRAIGIELPTTQPVTKSLSSADSCLPPQYCGRVGTLTQPGFRTLVLGPWVFHLCWGEEGCADADGFPLPGSAT